MRWTFLLSLSAAVTRATPIPASTTTSTSTSTTTPTPTPTPSVCTPAAPTVSCVKYPECPQFTTPLSNACPANNSQCKDNYFVRCENRPAAGSEVILAIDGIPTADVCRQRCDGSDACAAFAFLSTNCVLYRSINGFISHPATTFIRICADSCAAQPVRRGEEEKGNDKSVSVAKWTQGKKHRGPKDT